MKHIYFIFKWKKSRVVLVVMLIIFIYFYPIISTFKPTIIGNVAQDFDALLSVLTSVQVSKFLCIFLRSQRCSYNYHPHLAGKSSYTSPCLQNEKNILSVKLKTWQWQCTTRNTLLLTESSSWNCSLPKPLQQCSAARKANPWTTAWPGSLLCEAPCLTQVASSRLQFLF